jgi:hypothetical protein
MITSVLKYLDKVNCEEGTVFNDQLTFEPVSIPMSFVQGIYFGTPEDVAKIKEIWFNELRSQGYTAVNVQAIKDGVKAEGTKDKIILNGEGA